VIKDKVRFKPYTNGKPTFKERNRAGVYKIYKNGVLRYVGYSGNDLYKALYRHFQQWNDKSQVRTTYNYLEGIEIEITITKTKLEASRLEKALIINEKPTDNPAQYWLEFDTDNKEEEIYKEYIYKHWRKPKKKPADAQPGEEYPF